MVNLYLLNGGIMYIICFLVIFIVSMLCITLTQQKMTTFDFYNVIKYKKIYPIIKNIKCDTDNVFCIKRDDNIKIYILDSNKTSINLSIGNMTYEVTFNEKNNNFIKTEYLDTKYSVDEFGLFFPNSKIPKKIMQTYITDFIGKNAYLNMARTILMNDDCEYFYYNNKEAYNFILDHDLPKEVLLAYNMILPGAFKADIFRLCWLYIEGGIYMDISMYPILPFRDMFSDIYTNNNNIFVQDYKFDCIYNALIISEQKSPVILKLLKDTSKNIINMHKEKINTDVLNYTGPKCVYRILNTISNNKYCINMKHNNSAIYSSKTNNKLFKTKYVGYISDRWNMHYGEACKKNIQFGIKFPETNTKNIFHCLGSNWGTQRLVDNISKWDSYNYDYEYQKKFIKEYVPEKLHFYENILDEFICEKYFSLLRLYVMGGMYINPFIKKENDILSLFTSKQEFVYTDSFIFAKRPNNPTIKNILLYIEKNMISSVFSKWTKYIEQYNKTTYYNIWFYKYHYIDIKLLSIGNYNTKTFINNHITTSI